MNPISGAAGGAYPSGAARVHPSDPPDPSVGSSKQDGQVDGGDEGSSASSPVEDAAQGPEALGDHEELSGPIDDAAKGPNGKGRRPPR
jgi:hypothetical protein